LTQLLKLSFGVPKWLQAIPGGSNGLSEGSGKSGGLFNVQSDLRAHLARSEEASPRVCFPETGQSQPAKPIFDSPNREPRRQAAKEIGRRRGNTESLNWPGASGSEEGLGVLGGWGERRVG
jgi:hypothetical protein